MIRNRLRRRRANASLASSMPHIDRLATIATPDGPRLANIVPPPTPSADRLRPSMKA